MNVELNATFFLPPPHSCFGNAEIARYSITEIGSYIQVYLESLFNEEVLDSLSSAQEAVTLEDLLGYVEGTSFEYITELNESVIRGFTSDTFKDSEFKDLFIIDNNSIYEILRLDFVTNMIRYTPSLFKILKFNLNLPKPFEQVKVTIDAHKLHLALSY